MTAQQYCNHIRGRVYTLNPEEGPAWIQVWQRTEGPQAREEDWVYAFTHCPLCGEKLPDPPEDDLLVT